MQATTQWLALAAARSAQLGTCVPSHPWLWRSHAALAMMRLQAQLCVSAAPQGMPVLAAAVWLSHVQATSMLRQEQKYAGPAQRAFHAPAI